MSLHKIVAFMPAPDKIVLDTLSFKNNPSVFDLYVSRPPYSEDAICQCLKDAEIIFTWVGGPYLSRKILESAKNLKFVEFVSVGYEKIDLQAASELGIPVANNPGWNAISVAEHTLMSMLVLLKKAFYAHQGMLQEKWLQNELIFNDQVWELHGKTVGILGLGNIGLQVAKLVKPFEVLTLYNKRTRLPASEEEELGVKYGSLDDLLTASDILSLHIPLTDTTRGMIGSGEIGKMRDGAILVNTARAEIVDEAALADALRTKKLSGAAIDVPRGSDDFLKFSKTFAGLNNVLFTPHVSGNTKEGTVRGRIQASENIKRYLDGVKPYYLVNRL